MRHGAVVDASPLTSVTTPNSRVGVPGAGANHTEDELGADPFEEIV